MTMQTGQSQELQEKEEQHLEGRENGARGRAYVPRSDVYETNEEIVVVAEMPGVDEKNVSITLERNVLTITGQVRSEAPEGYRLALNEYGTGDYERRFALSQNVDRDGISAAVKSGILTLTLPKAREAQPRRIEVKAG
jgi:HSP20 family molecular chaperone IbpA